jgi:SAM-dependent methyltransferase
MVATSNARARAEGIPESVFKAVVGDLFDKANPSPAQFSGLEWEDFDLAIAGFAFHHFEDVIYAAKCLKERLRPGGALVITDFLEGGDLKADESGAPIPGSEGNHGVHHNHHHHHQGQKHGGDDGKKANHHHHHGHHDKKDHDDDPTREVREEMNASIVTPHFTIDFVKNTFIKAGLVDVDVVTSKERVYMEFAGAKIWRTILYAKGRRPLEDKSEL